MKRIFGILFVLPVVGTLFLASCNGPVIHEDKGFHYASFVGEPGRPLLFVIEEDHASKRVQEEIRDILTVLRRALGVRVVLVEGMPPLPYVGLDLIALLEKSLRSRFFPSNEPMVVWQVLAIIRDLGAKRTKLIKGEPFIGLSLRVEDRSMLIRLALKGIKIETEPLELLERVYYVNLSDLVTNLRTGTLSKTEFAEVLNLAGIKMVDIGGKLFVPLDRPKLLQLVRAHPYINIRPYINEFDWSIFVKELSKELSPSALSAVLKGLRYFFTGIELAILEKGVDLQVYGIEDPNLWGEHAELLDEVNQKEDRLVEQLNELLESLSCWLTVEYLWDRKGLPEELPGFKSPPAEVFPIIEGALERLQQINKGVSLKEFLKAVEKKSLHEALKEFSNPCPSEETEELLYRAIIEEARTHGLDTAEAEKLLQEWEESLSKETRIGEKRDEAMVTHALEILETVGAKNGVVIIGAGHTVNFCRLLRQRGVSYVVISPRSLHSEITETEYYHYLYRIAGLQPGSNPFLGSSPLKPSLYTVSYREDFRKFGEIIEDLLREHPGREVAILFRVRDLILHVSAPSDFNRYADLVGFIEKTMQALIPGEAALGLAQRSLFFAIRDKGILSVAVKSVDLENIEELLETIISFLEEIGIENETFVPIVLPSDELEWIELITDLNHLYWRKHAEEEEGYAGKLLFTVVPEKRPLPWAIANLRKFKDFSPTQIAFLNPFPMSEKEWNESPYKDFIKNWRDFERDVLPRLEEVRGYLIEKG
ncbi:MAG TPA: hypothetical protein ENF51_00530, partial [Candidatus Aenigmarchaeota archaeon]|nr:hypothetical protein [Candidatus Aenigmarchaeota archaeon]